MLVPGSLRTALPSCRWLFHPDETREPPIGNERIALPIYRLFFAVEVGGVPPTDGVRVPRLILQENEDHRFVVFVASGLWEGPQPGRDQGAHVSVGVDGPIERPIHPVIREVTAVGRHGTARAVHYRGVVPGFVSVGSGHSQPPFLLCVALLLYVCDCSASTLVRMEVVHVRCRAHRSGHAGLVRIAGSVRHAALPVRPGQRPASGPGCSVDLMPVRLFGGFTA